MEYHLLTLIWVAGWGEGVILLPCQFSVNNSKTIKAATLTFCSIQVHFIREIRVEFGIPNVP